ncbi:hypothetical protein RchiOBHm_Chr4g0413291 [Rosa chinensis]|uniref:Uncharacterized protein n=1 Tax=Rosa chinensis TaxID=74649 RepID=A0A2P6QW09_ROSCH|nr:hypothetical protein RchiOBHm_Chr4g0413291 [Rosa chinensis]
MTILPSTQLKNYNHCHSTSISLSSHIDSLSLSKISRLGLAIGVVWSFNRLAVPGKVRPGHIGAGSLAGECVRRRMLSYQR